MNIFLVDILIVISQVYRDVESRLKVCFYLVGPRVEWNVVFAFFELTFRFQLRKEGYN